jgi:putative YjhG/YagF family dehydratase
MSDVDILDVKTFADGPQGKIALTEDMLLHGRSGDLFALSQNAAMKHFGGKLQKDFLIVSTQGGMRGPKGENIASGLHIGHWELGLVAEAAANQFKKREASPFYVAVSDPCDGRTQGTPGMMDSLAYRNAAAMTMGHLIRSTPSRKGVMGVATCDKGVPATLIALAGEHDMPTIFVPGGVSLPVKGSEHLGPVYGKNINAGLIQGAGTQFATGKATVAQLEEAGCKACGTPGGGCQFLGTAATSQVVAEALGMSLPHSALMPSGQPIWLDMGARSADALVEMDAKHIKTKDILTDDAIHNAMVVHAAFGGSTNLLIHIPAIAHAAGLKRPTRADWEEINRKTPRLVDVLPNNPDYSTVHAFMAGGVPEVMLHLRDLGLLKLDAKTVTGKTLGENLKEWEHSERRQKLRSLLKERDGIDPDKVIYPGAEAAKAAGLTSTVTFPDGNLAPEGSVIKSTAIDKSMVHDGVYSHKGPARVFTSEDDAMAAIKGTDATRIPPIKAGDVIILMGYGPMGMGMPETFQITRALKESKVAKEVALLTDGRFSGVSTGPCIGHIGPEALAGGPIGKIKNGDIIDIKIDCKTMAGNINFVGTDAEHIISPAKGAEILARRPTNPDVKPHPDLPSDVRAWAAKQNACGGPWGGCVEDADTISRLLELGAAQEKALAPAKPSAFRQ